LDLLQPKPAGVWGKHEGGETERLRLSLIEVVCHAIPMIYMCQHTYRKAQPPTGAILQWKVKLSVY
jgi:hypothetical protein